MGGETSRGTQHCSISMQHDTGKTHCLAAIDTLPTTDKWVG